MKPPRDLKDPYGQLVEQANLALFRSHFQSRVKTLSTESAAAQELFTLKWGPTKIPVYNVILAFIFMNPPERPKYLALGEWLVKTAKVPVDGTDMSGTTALMHSISTKPYFDTSFAQLLLDAGADINHRNRFGCTAAHDSIKIYQFDSATTKKSCDALRCFLENGGNPDIQDGDGMSVTFMITRLKPMAPGLNAVLVQSKQRKNEATATQGGQEDDTKPSRNKPCPCGSNRKYKKCCGKDDVPT